MLANQNKFVLTLGMTIDYEMDRLYWVDDYKDTINYLGLDGSGRSHFAAYEQNQAAGHLFGITLSNVT